MAKLKTAPKESGAPEPLQSSLQSALYRVMEMLIIRADTGSPLLALPILQVKCLNIIAQCDDQTMGQVARKLDIDLPGLSRIVDRLFARGMVERRIDPSNRRVTHLALTEKARALLAERKAARQAHLEACLRHLDPVEAERILESLRLLAEAAERSLPTEPSPAASDEDPIVNLLTRYPRTRRKARER